MAMATKSNAFAPWVGTGGETWVALAARASVSQMTSVYCAPLPQGPVGPYFELRYYTLKAGRVPELQKGWESMIPERVKMSPIVLAGPVDFGVANAFVHIWAYKSLDQRMQIRADAAKTSPRATNAIFFPSGEIVPSAS